MYTASMPRLRTSSATTPACSTAGTESSMCQMSATWGLSLWAQSLGEVMLVTMLTSHPDALSSPARSTAALSTPPHVTHGSIISTLRPLPCVARGARRSRSTRRPSRMRRSSCWLGHRSRSPRATGVGSARGGRSAGTTRFSRCFWSLRLTLMGCSRRAVSSSPSTFTMPLRARDTAMRRLIVSSGGRCWRPLAAGRADFAGSSFTWKKKSSANSIPPRLRSTVWNSCWAVLSAVRS